MRYGLPGGPPNGFGAAPGSMSAVSANDECIEDLCDDQSNPNPDCRNDVIPVPAPCSCPYADFSEGPEKLRIVGYTDGDIPVSECPHAMTMSHPVWDGTFPDRHPYCVWTHPGGTHNIDTLQLEMPPAQVWLDQTNCRWVLHISYWPTDTYSVADAWVGYKDTGGTPEGTYFFDDGCAGSPDALVIESY